MPLTPDHLERRYYYRGVGGILLARTSTFDFSGAITGNDRELGAIRFTNIGQHPIVSLWSEDVVRYLQEVLGEIPWERFFPIRVEVVWPYVDDTLNEKRKAVVLIVEVPQGAMGTDEAETAAAVAWKCRTVLNVFRIVDVEVEVRAIDRQMCAMDAGLESSIQQQDWGREDLAFSSKVDLTLDSFLPALSHIGYQITPEFEASNRYGTMGAHLRLEQSPSRVYGLTCRHVVHKHEAGFGSNKRGFWLADGESYVHDGDTSLGDGRQKHRVLQMCKDSLQRLQMDVDVELEGAEKELRTLTLASTKYTSDPKSFPEPTTSDINDLKSLEKALPELRKVHAMLTDERMEEDDARAIGHVFAMSPLDISSKRPEETSGGFLRDWALVQLDQAKFDACGVKNQIFVSHRNLHDLRKLARRYEGLKPMALFISENRDSEGFVRLRGDSKTGRRNDEYTSIAVGKRGAATNLTFGITNEIKAVVRVNYGRREVAWEWIVVSPEPSAPFAKPGDSGSVIFDSDGSVIGLISGGCSKGSEARRLRRESSAGGGFLSGRDESEGEGRDHYDQTPDGFARCPPSTDLTFATPIHAVLEDIELITKSGVRFL
ncbi:hypothetical protein F4861DRAFT_521981 [Xylaria intraflava]|nr:hypothetical protein F4861DRAFT_521981 [Xylaria intraflava]